MPLDPRPLSQRFDLTYVRRRQWPYNWMLAVSLVLAMSAGAYLALLSIRGDQRIHSPGDLARVHAMINDNCAACHQPDPDRHGYWLPVSDSACLRCHLAAAHPDPHGRRFLGGLREVSDRLAPIQMSSQCAACHTEHRGRDALLTRVGDQTCVQCHSDLQAYAATPAGAYAEAAGIANTVTSFDKGHPEFRIVAQEAIDESLIRFEHHVHMNPHTPQMQQRLRDWVRALESQGVDRRHIAVCATSGPRGEPLGEVAAEGPIPEGIALALSCHACHEADVAGRHMLPINFERHCMSCHGLGSRGPNKEPVPHGFGLDRYIDRVAMQTATVPKASGATGARAGPPGRRGGPPVTAAEKPQVEETAADLIRRIGEEREMLETRILPNCIKCHGPVQNIAEIQAPGMPLRWLEKSRFDHAAHRTIACTECHPAASHRGVVEVDYKHPRAQELAWTGHTRDIMVPSIESCRQCHSPAGHTRHDCVTCHQYHGPDQPGLRTALPAWPGTIAEFLGRPDVE